MKQSRELYNTLRNVLGKDAEVFPAVVKSVDKVNCTCEIEFDELPLGGIRLRATVNDNAKGAKIFPAVESVVLVQRLGEIEEFFITLYSEIDEVVYEAGDCVFEMDGSGFQISKGSDSLKAVIVDLLAAIKALTVPTNVGPSGVPINQPAFNAIESRVNNILK